MREPSRRSFEFGPFLLDVGKRLLLRHGEPVPLAPKVLDTLLALVEHRQDVVSKEQLLSLVWADTRHRRRRARPQHLVAAKDPG